MTYQEILQGITQRRAQMMQENKFVADDMWWALQALAEKGVEIEQWVNDHKDGSIKP